MLTATQRATLKSHIQNTTALNAYVVDEVWTAIAALLNEAASPAWTVWKSRVSQDEIMQNGFDWTQVDGLTAGKARIWEWMFANADKAINPSKENVRAGIDEAWKGTAPMLAVRAAVYVHCKRSASSYEKLFSSGTGTDASPATFGIGQDGAYLEGEIGWSEIQLTMSE